MGRYIKIGLIIIGWVVLIGASFGTSFILIKPLLDLYSNTDGTIPLQEAIPVSIMGLSIIVSVLYIGNALIALLIFTTLEMLDS